MIDRQMELGIPKSARHQSIARRHRRTQRARWWFARMRQVVDSAMDWPPATLSDPEPNKKAGLFLVTES